MAACGSLSSLFENPLPENPIIESLSSWNHNKPTKPIEASSFAEIFGELYFQEKLESPAIVATVPTPPPLAPPELDQATQPRIPVFDSKSVQPCEKPKDRYKCDVKGSGGFSSKNAESLQFCTEGLGSESSDDVDDLMDIGDDWRTCGKGKGETGRRQLMYSGANRYSKSCWDVKSLKSEREFPPSISSIGKSRKHCVCLKSYRENGRFVLREIRIPTQELLHASREDGRLKLNFVHPDEDIAEGGEEEEEEEEEEDDDGKRDGRGEAAGGEIKEDVEEKVDEGENHQ